MTSSRGARLLLVEDNDTDVLVFGERLAEVAPWVTVDVAGDGVEALDRLARGDYGLVVLDLNLPSIDGREVLRRARADDPALPIVVVTTSSSSTDRDTAMRLGADGFTVKPMGLDEYELMVDALVALWLTPSETR